MTDIVFIDSTIVSKDGTPINFRTLGKGPGLVIIHGTFRAANDYEQLARLLADAFTVHLVNRRGRGGSGPQGNGYDLDTEVEDISAVLQYTGASFLLGHSFGGAVALEAIFNNCPITKLAVYEPAISINNPLPVHLLPPIYTALTNENYKEAFIDIMGIINGGAMPEKELGEMMHAIMQSLVWPQMRDLLITVPAEIMAIHKTHGTYKKYRHLQTETLVMYGNNSPLTVINDMALLAEAIPYSKIVGIRDAAHNGPDMESPENVANELKAWFG